jgi:hypothetical protein
VRLRSSPLGGSCQNQLVKSSENRLTFRFARDGFRAKFESATILAADTWYHVAITKSADEVRIYLNGEPNAAAPFGPRESSIGTDEGSRLYLGATRRRRDFFQGKLDEILFYNRVLTPDEILGNTTDFDTGRLVVTNLPWLPISDEHPAQDPNIYSVSVYDIQTATSQII